MSILRETEHEICCLVVLPVFGREDKRSDLRVVQRFLQRVRADHPKAQMWADEITPDEITEPDPWEAVE